MAYNRPERLGSHGERRVIGILTLSNIVGGLAGLASMWVLAGLLGLASDEALSAAWLLRAAVACSGAAAGVLATLRWSGISLWDQLMLWAGYQIRRSAGQTLLSPPLAGRPAGVRAIAPVLRGGRVIAELYDPHELDRAEEALP